jgi:hypothetical protein
MPVVSKIFFIALDDKFKFCFLLFLGDSMFTWVLVSNFGQVSIIISHSNGIWHQAGGLDSVSKLVFVKIENNNLFCVVLNKNYCFWYAYLIFKITVILC